MGQVRACLHHNDSVAGPGNVEPKAVRLHTEAGSAARHLRSPYRRGPTGERSAPAQGPWQVIHRRGGIIQRSVAGHDDVAVEVDRGEFDAAAECPVLDPNVGGDGNAGQIATAVERADIGIGDGQAVYRVGMGGTAPPAPVYAVIVIVPSLFV